MNFDALCAPMHMCSSAPTWPTTQAQQTTGSQLQCPQLQCPLRPHALCSSAPTWPTSRCTRTRSCWCRCARLCTHSHELNVLLASTHSCWHGCARACRQVCKQREGVPLQRRWHCRMFSSMACAVPQRHPRHHPRSSGGGREPRLQRPPCLPLPAILPQFRGNGLAIHAMPSPHHPPRIILLSLPAHSSGTTSWQSSTRWRRWEWSRLVLTPCLSLPAILLQFRDNTLAIINAVQAVGGVQTCTHTLPVSACYPAAVPRQHSGHHQLDGGDGGRHGADAAAARQVRPLCATCCAITPAGLLLLRCSCPYGARALRDMLLRAHQFT